MPLHAKSLTRLQLLVATQTRKRWVRKTKTQERRRYGTHRSEGLLVFQLSRCVNAADGPEVCAGSASERGQLKHFVSATTA
jgi:hypothetical protein